MLSYAKVVPKLSGYVKLCQSYKVLLKLWENDQVLPKLSNYAKLCQNCEILWNYAIFFRVMTNYGKVFKIFQSYAKVI